MTARFLADMDGRGRQVRFAVAVLAVLSAGFAWAQAHVYVQPDGAAGFTPTPPYASWETAAANLHEAQHLFLDGVTVHLKEGQYSTSSNLVVSSATTVVGAGYDKTAIVNTHAGRQGGNNNPLSKTRTMTVSNAGAWIEGVRISGGWPCSSALGEDGGGLYLSAGVVTNCQISGNQTQLTGKKGAGVRILGGALTHCRIVNNTGNNNGVGAIYASGGAVVENCLVANNCAKGGGGGICIAGSATVRNCTFVGNASSAAGVPAGVYVQTDGVHEIRNCVFAENVNTSYSGTKAPEWNEYGNNATKRATSRSRFVNCAFGIPAGADSIEVPNDTCLAFSPAWADADFRIAGSSPLVDRGSAVAGDSGEDLDGNDRVFNGVVDIGCYECSDVAYVIDAEVLPTEVLEGGEVTFVAKTGNEPADATFTWTLSADGQDDVVFTGRCVTNVIGRAGHYDVTLASEGAATVVKKGLLRVGAHTNYLVAAGTTGVNPTPPYASWETAATNINDVLDAAMNGGTVLVGPGTYRTRADIVLNDGIRVIGVNGAEETVVANGQGSGSGAVGYRVFVLNNAKALLRGLTVADGVGRAGMDGGGVLIKSLGGTVEDCIVTNNSINGGVSCYGAGIACESPQGVVRRTTIAGNVSKAVTNVGAGGGGGAYLSAGIMENCLVSGNEAHAAGGVYQDGGSVVNCTIAANRVVTIKDVTPTARFAGGLYVAGGYATNALVVCNATAYAGGTCPAYPEVQYGASLSNRFVNCGVTAPAAVPNGTCVAAEDAADCFADAAGDYRLVKHTAFYKQGLCAPWMLGWTDLDGRPRVSCGERVDIGCYETDYEPYALVLNGEPKMEIVYPEGGHSVEKFAAEDLAHWVGEISGAQLPVAAATGVVQSASGAPRVYVGRAFAEGAFAKDLAEIGETDGFAIRRKGADLYLFGGEPRSAVYATSRLLEENTDIIWARPAAEFGTVFTTNATVELTATDRLEKPLFWMHGWDVAGVRRDYDTGKWALRNGANLAVQTEPKNKDGALGLVNMLSGHNYWWIAKPENDFADHPEFFGYNATTRKREGNTLCLTAKGLVELAVQKYLDRIESSVQGGRPVEMFLLGMRDSWICCQCEQCTAPIPLPDGTTLACKSTDVQQDERYYSTRYWMFVRDVCTRLREVHPDIRYYGWGYFYGRTPPACELPKWLHCEFCPYGGFTAVPYLDEAQTPSFRDALTAWSELLPGHVSYLEYWFCESSGVPAVGGIGSVPRWQRNMQDLAHVLGGPGLEAFIGPDSMRTNGVMEIRAEWDANPMARWLATRLMWNPDQDLETLKRFYFTRAYREAADVMAEYMELMSRQTHDPSIRAKARTVMNSNERRRLEDLLVLAHETARHPTAKTLIGRQLDHWMIVKKSAGSEEVPFAGPDEPCREFGNVSWEYAFEIPEFKLPPYFNWSGPEAPAARTEVLAQHDGSNLCLRVTCEAKTLEGDWLYLRLKPGASAVDAAGKSVTAAFTRKITPFDADVTRKLGGYSVVIVVPFEQLGLDTDLFGSYPTYEFLRYDAATRERSTPKGQHINLACGTFAF